MPVLLIVLEAVALAAAVCGGLLQRGGTLEQALVLCGCCAVSFYYNDLHDLGIVHSFSELLSRLPRAIAWSLILLAVAWGLLPDARLPAATLALTLLLGLAVLIPLRAAAYLALRWRPFRERILIVGTGPLARQICREVDERPHLRVDVIGFVGENVESSTAMPGGRPIFGEVWDLTGIILEQAPDRILVALAERRGGIPIRRLVELRLNGVEVEDGEEFYERLTGKIILESLSPSSFVFGRPSGRTRLHLALARAASIAVSATGLALTAPLFPLIAAAIRLESRGPVFFVQERVGRRGRRYRMLKFRTMRSVDQEDSMWAGDNGYRITRVGAVLRKFRLDELPQFVNILLGDMNLVGPRPHPATNFQLFAQSIPHYEVRLAVRPGVTGWAQTRYCYANNLEQETEKVRYDLYYIKHMSAWLDLRILFDTVKVVLLGRRSDMSRPLSDPAREGPTRVHDTAA